MSQMEYIFQDFKLEIEPGRVKLLESDTTGTRTKKEEARNDSFQLPDDFDTEAVKQIEKLVMQTGDEAEGRHSHYRSEDLTREPRLAVKEQGQKLFDSLFPANSALRSLYIQSFAQSNTNTLGKQTRMRLRLVVSPHLAYVPWEILHASENMPGADLTLTASIVRMPTTESAVAAPHPTSLPLNVLLVAGSPYSEEQDWLVEEKQLLQEALEGIGEKLITAKRLTLEEGETSTLAALGRCLEQEDIHILHFIGHGYYDVEEENPSGRLEMVKDGLSHHYTGHEVAEKVEIGVKKGLRLVVLNACEGARSLPPKHSLEFTGVAQALLNVGVPAVLAMQYEISDPAAKSLTPALYKRLVQTWSVDEAVRAARSHLLDTFTDTLEWVTPVLYLTRDDGRLFELESPPPKRLTVIPGLTKDMIEKRTQGFVGREHVFTAIDSFMIRHLNGYLEIEGDPGVGKSALLAEYVRRTGAVSYFNERAKGNNTARHFLKSVCAQLIERYALRDTYPELPPEATEDGSFFDQLLNQVGARLHETESLVIAVDALDEVDSTRQPDGTNILYLPPTLPDRIYFIMTRQQIKLPLAVDVYELFDVMKYPDENLQDAWEYIRRATKERPKLRTWVDSRPQPITVEEFVTKLAEKSENNFLYLHHVLQAIESGVYKDLNIADLPTGLQGHYEEYWRRMGMMAEEPSETKIKVLYTLCEIKRPASCRLIADFAQEKKKRPVRKVLKEWDEFLHEQDVDGDKYYSVYHDSFRDFLRRQDTIKDAEDDDFESKSPIADNLWDGLFGDGAGVAEQLASMYPERRLYTLQLLPVHLADVGQGERLSQLLSSFDFIAAKVSDLGPQSLIEDYELTFLSGLPTDSDMVKTLRLIKGAVKLAAHILAEDPTQLAGQLIGRLLSFEAPEIQELLAQARQWQAVPWLRPLTPSLTSPGGPLLRTLGGHTAPVKAVTVTQDGRRAISASGDNTLKMWNLESGEVMRTFSGHTQTVNAIALTPDERRVVSASWDKTLKVWDLESGEVVRTLNGHTREVMAVATMPDGQRAISASGDRTLRVWDLESGEVVCTLPSGHTAPIQAVAVTSDGRRAVSASEDCTLKVWDLESGEAVHTLSEHSGRVTAAAVTPDGQRVISASWDKTARVWNLESGEAVRIFSDHTNQVTAVAVTPDGQKVVSASADHTLKVWDLESGEAVRTFSGHTNTVNAVAVTQDGRRAISASNDRTLKVWDLENGEAAHAIDSHADMVTALVVTPDGQWAISASLDRTLKVWDLESGRAVRTFSEHTAGVTAVTATRVGQRAILAFADGMLKVWDLEDGKVVRTLGEHSDSVSAVAVTPDGKRAVSASNDETLIVWDLESGKPLRTLKGHTGWVEAVVVTRNGRRAVSASTDNTLKVWDLESGEMVRTLGDDTGFIEVVAVTPDGRQAVSASWDESLKVWDLESGELVRAIPHGGNPGSWVKALAMMPDGQRVISASAGNTLTMWDIASGRAITTFDAGGPLYACDVAPDGLTIVAGDAFGRIHFLRLEGD